MSKNVLFALITLTLLAITHQVLAQNVTDMIYLEFPNRKLLPDANVSCVIQDKDGYIWYGTEGGGLCRDNGYNIDVFRTDNNKSHPSESNYITCIAEDKENRIWFGTLYGTFILDKKDYSIHILNEEVVVGKKTKAIIVTPDSCIWIAVGTDIVRYSPRGRHVYTYNISQKGNTTEVRDFYCDSKGTLWVCLWHGGLVSTNIATPFDSTTACKPYEEIFKEHPWNTDTYPSTMIEDSTRECYWIAAWGKGLVKYTPNGNRTFTTQPTHNFYFANNSNKFGNEIQNLIFDTHSDTLWASTMDDIYAFRFTNGEPEPVSSNGIVPQGKKLINKIMKDHRGNLWVPGYSPLPFVLTRNGGTILRDPITAMEKSTGYKIMADRVVCYGQLYWIYQNRTRLSLYNSETGDMTFMANDASPSPLSTTKCLEPCSEGGLWTCKGKSLYKVWNEDMNIKWKHIDNATTEEYISALHDNGNGTLLIGTAKAVYKYEYKRKHLSKLAASKGIVRDIDIDKNGMVLFTADNIGLNIILNGTKVLNIGEDKGIKNVEVDNKGHVWAASSSGHVYRILDIVAHKIPVASNANGDAIKDLHIDNMGHVWIMSNLYVKEYNPDNEAFRIIRNTDCNIQTDCFLAFGKADKKICIGGVGALCVTTPTYALNGNAENTAIKVSAITIDNKMHLAINDSFTIPTKYENITVHLTSFDHLNATNIQFAYKICNNDTLWATLPRGENKLELTNLLKTGTNRIEFKATDGYGRWSDTTTTLIIECKVLWYNTMTARIIGSLLLLLLIYIAATFTNRWKRAPYSSKSLQETCRTINNIADERHTEYNDLVSQVTQADTNHEMSESDRKFIEAVNSCIEKNLSNPNYRVEQLSSDLFMSRMNLYRKLQALTGLSPTETIRNARMKKAADLLKQRTYNINEIAEQTGFSSAKYFSRCFKETFGVQPKQYTN